MMGLFKHTYPYPREFDNVGLVQPDEIVEWDSNPDPRFFEEVEETAQYALSDDSSNEDEDTSTDDASTSDSDDNEASDKED
jgi:hypothetical protein